MDKLKKQADEGPIDMIGDEELGDALDGDMGEGDLGGDLGDMGDGDFGGDLGGMDDMGEPGGDMKGAPQPVDDTDWEAMKIIFNEDDLDYKRKNQDDGLDIDYSKIT